MSLDQFGRKLSIGILVICALLFAVSVFLRGENVMNAFLFAVALAVAAIPEALSSIVTIVLSFGTQKMARGARHHPQAPGGGGPGQRVRHLLRQDRYPDPEQDDCEEALHRGQIIPADGADFSRPEQRSCCVPPCYAATPR